MARAIENECYVAMAGSVGNLPKVHNMDMQYAQSMVITPCDFPFPSNGIKAEATPKYRDDPNSRCGTFHYSES